MSLRPAASRAPPYSPHNKCTYSTHRPLPPGATYLATILFKYQTSACPLIPCDLIATTLRPDVPVVSSKLRGIIFTPNSTYVCYTLTIGRSTRCCSPCSRPTQPQANAFPLIPRELIATAICPDVPACTPFYSLSNKPALRPTLGSAAFDAIAEASHELDA